MFSTRIRLVLIAACLGAGAHQLYSGDRSGLWLIVAGALFAYGHFRYGPVWLAFRSLRKGKLERAAQLLSQVRNPAALSSPQRAYFELASGLIAASRDRGEAAEQHLRAALTHELRTANDRCVAEVELAEILAKRGNLAEARDLVARARTRRCKPELAEHLERVAVSLGVREGA